MRERERDSGEGRAHYSGEEQFQKAAGAPGNFERRAEHPQRDHVPEPVPEAAMDETVGVTCQISKGGSTARAGTRPRFEYAQPIMARDPNALRNRNTAVLIPSSHTTDLLKGGKLNVISLPLRRIRRVSLQGAKAALGLGVRNHGEAPVSFIINRPDGENHVIF